MFRKIVRCLVPGHLYTNLIVTKFIILNWTYVFIYFSHRTMTVQLESSDIELQTELCFSYISYCLSVYKYSGFLVKYTLENTNV